MKKKEPDYGYIEYEDGTRIKLYADDVPDLSDDPNIVWKPLRDEFPDLAAYSVARLYLV